MTKTLIITLTILFLIGVFDYLQKRHYIKTLRNLNERRPHLSRSEYINLLVKKGFDRCHIEVVHDNISQLVNIYNFSIYPEDDIHNSYAIDDLEDIEFIGKICKALNLRQVNKKDYNQLSKEMKVFNAEYILTLTKQIAQDKTLQPIA